MRSFALAVLDKMVDDAGICQGRCISQIVDVSLGYFAENPSHDLS
jgi:hypothetical protein